MSAIEALQTALAAEHAAIYAYGAIGAKLTGESLSDAAGADTAHRALRDRAATVVTALGADPAPEEPAYDLPELPNRAAALQLALQVEERTAAAWRAALPETSAAGRQVALDGLIDGATRAAGWRGRITPNAPSTVAFPGV